MIRIASNDTVKTGSYSTFNHNSIFIVIVSDCYSVLTVDTKRVYKFKNSIQFSHYLPCFFIDVFLPGKLLAGKEVDVGGFFCRYTAYDLFVGNGIKDFAAIHKPRFAALENINHNVCV